jgi:hypothetical protein
MTGWRTRRVLAHVISALIVANQLEDDSTDDWQ